jgi:predicted nucleotidyltransferase
MGWAQDRDGINIMKNIIARIVFGSKLYGTSIPESDNDFRSIYLPDIKECVLMQVRDAWEDKSEEDTSYFSFQHFIKMATEGQSIAIELLAAMDNNIIITSPIWEELHKNRKRFYSKNMKSFIGYAKTMAGKYSSRIDRLTETENILNVLKEELEDNIFSYRSQSTPILKLRDIWDKLPESLNAVKGTNNRQGGEDKRAYQVCGRELQASVTVSHSIEVIKAIYDSYGSRVRKAKENEVEYKALAHAFRAALQCKELAETGDLIFPLKDAEWLRDLRLGKFNFLECGLDKKLDDLILEVECSMKNSQLPDHADKAYAESIILKAYNL